jgi:hypothetical protein
VLKTPCRKGCRTDTSPHQCFAGDHQFFLVREASRPFLSSRLCQPIGHLAEDSYSDVAPSIPRPKRDVMAS